MSAASQAGVGVAQAAQAAGSSFYAGMRILPKPQREAMYAVYAFCRAVDDVADEGGTREERSAGLQRWRDGIDALYAGRPTPDTAPLAEAVRRYGLRREDFVAVIDGMAMDAAEDIRAPDEAKLDLYCDRVASAVGRLSVMIFGVSERNGPGLAHHLGRALQKTNILRDIDEDAAMGRLYLPREKLEAAGIHSTDPTVVAADPALPRVCAPIVQEARRHFAEAQAIMAREPRRTTRAPRLMGAVYGAVLEATAKRGFSAPRQRVRKPKLKLLISFVRHGLF
ncbi:presqualene diphosphate synthase HpnD [Lichenibacterium dinghuense]|uniref:presqualene diphosphate synthase HpnD n=1 Tax=Lichenibacterium dinghuense TaxID=2895977 RepID=UPI00281636E6|nr:presqualene diphosphate synthase HpnD [Lichenibacterium sp. 6Y81]